jgi:hypothetical protein
MAETDPEFDLYRDPDEGGCHHCRDPKTCDECATEKAHDQYIEYLVKMLDEAVSVAATAVANAATNLRELVSPAVYYIELAEGATGIDALGDLATAARLLRNVQRITREQKRLLKADGR